MKNIFLINQIILFCKYEHQNNGNGQRNVDEKTIGES